MAENYIQADAKVSAAFIHANGIYVVRVTNSTGVQFSLFVDTVESWETFMHGVLYALSKAQTDARRVWAEELNEISEGNEDRP